MIDFRTLGATEMEEISGSAARPIAVQAKRLALVAYIALAGRGRHRRRDSIVALFWPDLDEQHARSALRQALAYLRRTLAASAIITRGEEEVGVAPEVLRCDAVQFDEAITDGRLEDAAALYRGDFLDGLFVADGSPELEQWIDSERARLRVSAANCAWSLAEASRQHAGGVSAAEWGRRAVSLAPLDESKLRGLIGLLDSIGDRAGAVEAYERFARRLASEYSAEPSAETEAQLRAIRNRSVASSNPRIISAAAASLDPNGAADGQRFASSARTSDRARSWRWPALITVVALVAVAAVVSRGSSPPVEPPTRQQITYSGDVSAPALAPDDRTIAFVKGSCPSSHTCSHDLVAQDVTGGHTLLLARGTQIHHPKWHPSGESVLFQATRVREAADTTPRGTYVVARLGGIPQRIGPGGAAAFTARGNTVVLAGGVSGETIKLRFVRSADLAVLDSASVPLTNGGVADLDVSPDGEWLALLIYRGQGDRRVVLVSWRRRMVTDSMTLAGRGLVRWTPAGDAVLLLLQGGNSDDIVLRLGVDRRSGRFLSDTVTQLRIPVGGATFDVSRDGTKLAFVDEARTATELIGMERIGERVEVRSLLLFTGGTSTVVLSPDGRAIALSRSDARGRNLYVIPFEGGVERPITSSQNHIDTPRWLRDDRLVFKQGLPSTQLFVANLTGSQPPRPFGPAGYSTGNPWYLQWLGDSLYALDQRDYHRVLLLDPSGSVRDTLQVPDTLNQLVTVTPDARHLWFFDRDLEKGRFYSLDRATNVVKVAFDAPPNFGVLGWANDAYVVASWPKRAASSPTIWRINPGGRHTHMLDLPADCDFRSLSMSRNGRRFVCTRTDAKTDIFLLRGVDLRH